MTPETIKHLRQGMSENKTNSTTTTISLADLTKQLNEVFPQKPPSKFLIEAMFNRFRPLRIRQGGEGYEQAEDMDIVDFLLGCNLLSRVN